MVKNKGNNSKKLIHKNITITEEQEEFIDENWINLSRFIQNKLEEIMSK